MGNVERVDKTLPLNDMIYHVRKDAELRRRWLEDLENLCREFGCSEREYQTLKAVDIRGLMDIGVHQYLIPHILRLFIRRHGHDQQPSRPNSLSRCLRRRGPTCLERAKWLRLPPSWP